MKIRLPLPYYAPEGEGGSTAPPAAPAAPTVAESTPPTEPVKAEGTPAEPPKSIVNQTEPQKEGEGKKEDVVAAPVDPATFIKDLKLPEGLDTADPALSKFAEIVNDSKLSAKDRAQALIDLQVEAAKKQAEGLTNAWNETQLDWQKQVKADPEIGGDKLQPTLQMISKGMDTVLGPELGKEFRTAMDFTGAGNHPAVVKGLAKVFAELSEGSHVPGNPSRGKMSPGQVFFPNSPEFSGEQKGNG